MKKKDKAAELSRSEVPGSLPYVWKKIRTRRLAMAGLIFVAVLLVLSFISPLICP